MPNLPIESRAVAARRSSAIAVCLTSGVIATYAGALVSQGRFLSDDLWGLHEFLFCILIAMWFVADSRARGRFSPSFDHGWFVLLVLPLYALYHLIVTRRWRGVAIGIGMVGLFILPVLAQVLVYLAR